MKYEECAGLIAQLQQVIANPPQEQDFRLRIYEAAAKLTRALEPPTQTIHRVVYSPLELHVARMALDMGLFEVLARLGELSMKLDYLSRLCHADEQLLGRILRFCASHGMIEEVGTGAWRANNATKALATPEAKVGISHNHDVVAPCWQQLPRFVRETGNQNPNNPEGCAFHLGHRTVLPQIYFLRASHQLDNYYAWTAYTRKEQDLTFLDTLDFDKEYRRPCAPDGFLFVHVAATMSTQCNALKQRHPRIAGNIILQSLPTMLPRIKLREGVSKMAHDARTPQPITGMFERLALVSTAPDKCDIGARFYYFRQVGSNFSAAEFAVILKRTMDAMDRDSLILIDDMVIPDQGSHWIATQIDMAAMAFSATHERSRLDWEYYLSKLGLRIVKVGVYNRERRDAVIIAAPIEQQCSNGRNDTKALVVV